MKPNQKFSSKSSTPGFAQNSMQRAEPSRVAPVRTRQAAASLVDDDFARPRRRIIAPAQARPVVQKKPTRVPVATRIDFSGVPFNRTAASQLVPEAHFAEGNCSKKCNCLVEKCIKADKITTDNLNAANAAITSLTVVTEIANNLTVANETVNNSTITNATITDAIIATETVNDSVINTLTVEDVTINGQFILKDPVVISVPTLFGGADLTKPTIQEAINYFNGRAAMNGTILVAPGGGTGPNGAYIESLIINKLVSSRDNFRGQGFKIIGDDRNIAGTTFLQNGIHSNAIPVPNFGTNLVAVTLSNVGNAITVVGPTIDFALAGLVVGDELKIRNNSGTWSLVSITSIAGNTLTHNGGSLAVGTIGSAVVLVPNTELGGSINGEPIVAVENASLSFIGFWVNTDATRGTVGTPRNTLFAYNGASVQLECCLFDNQTGNLGFENVVAYDRSALILSRTNDIVFEDGSGIQMPTTVIDAGNVCVLVINLSNFMGGALSSFDAYGIFVAEESNAITYVFQAVGGGAGAFSQRISFLELQRARIYQCNAGVYAQAGTIGLDVELIIDGGAITPTNVGIVSDIFGQIGLGGGGGVSITNVSAGIVIERSGQMSVNSPSAYPVFGTIGTGGNITATYLSSFDASVNFPGNVFPYTVGPNVVMESAFHQQDITSVGAINIALNPGAVSTLATVRRYIGSTYTITSKNTAPHTIIVGGAFIERFGLANTTVMTFSTTFPNSWVTFTVKSATSVQILASAGVTFA